MTHPFLQVHFYFHISQTEILFVDVFLCKQQKHFMVLKVLDIISDYYCVVWPSETVHVEVDYNTNGGRVCVFL